MRDFKSGLLLWSTCDAQGLTQAARLIAACQGCDLEALDHRHRPIQMHEETRWMAVKGPSRQPECTPYIAGGPKAAGTYLRAISIEVRESP